MRSHNRVVEADVGIVVVAGNLFNLGNVAVALVCARSNRVDGQSQVFCFGGGLLCPDARFNVGCLARMDAEVLGNHGELRTAASLQEEDLVIVRHFHQLPHLGFRMLDDRLIS